MRLIRHVAPGQTSGKAVALRKMVRSEFRKPLLLSPETTTTTTTAGSNQHQSSTETDNNNSYSYMEDVNTRLCREDAAIEARKANAIRALSNYMLAVSAPKDVKLKSSVQDYHGRSVQKAKETMQQQQPTQQQQLEQQQQPTSDNHSMSTTTISSSTATTESKTGS